MSIIITFNLSVFAFCSSFDSVRLEEKRWWKQTFGVELEDLENTFPHMSPTPSARSHIDRGQYGGLSDSDIKTIPFSELKQRIASFDQDTQINIIKYRKRLKNRDDVKKSNAKHKQRTQALVYDNERLLARIQKLTTENTRLRQEKQRLLTQHLNITAVVDEHNKTIIDMQRELNRLREQLGLDK